MERSEERLVLTVPEVAKRLGLGRNAAYALVRTKGFPAIRIGKHIRVPVAALERWLEEQVRTQGGGAA